MTPPTRSYATLTDGKMTLESMPTGMIVLWRGDKAPEGWLVCDGQNGTPNLSPHIPKGQGYRLVYIQKG